MIPYYLCMWMISVCILWKMCFYLSLFTLFASPSLLHLLLIYVFYENKVSYVEVRWLSPNIDFKVLTILPRKLMEKINSVINVWEKELLSVWRAFMEKKKNQSQIYLWQWLLGTGKIALGIEYRRKEEDTTSWKIQIQIEKQRGTQTGGVERLKNWSYGTVHCLLCKRGG